MIEFVHTPRPPSGGGMPGFEVVPDSKGRMVGPFALLASIGPVDIPRGIPMDADARPHPHIGMCVLAYAKSGEITHRDNLGNVYPLRSGEITWMVSGRGIVHSERLETMRAEGGVFDGIVAFVALPDEAERVSASCRHIGREDIPVIRTPGAEGRLLLGNAFGARSPAQHYSPAYLIDWTLEPGARLSPRLDHPERAVHVVEGEIEHDGEIFGAGQMITLVPDALGAFRAKTEAKVIEFGGAPVGARYRWWNYIASRVGMIDAAKSRWLADDRSLPPGETEFTPLPADNERQLQLLVPGASSDVSQSTTVAAAAAA